MIRRAKSETNIDSRIVLRIEEFDNLSNNTEQISSKKKISSRKTSSIPASALPSSQVSSKNITEHTEFVPQDNPCELDPKINPVCKTRSIHFYIKRSDSCNRLELVSNF